VAQAERPQKGVESNSGGGTPGGNGQGCLLEICKMTPKRYLSYNKGEHDRYEFYPLKIP